MRFKAGDLVKPKEDVRYIGGFTLFASTHYRVKRSLILTNYDEALELDGCGGAYWGNFFDLVEASAPEPEPTPAPGCTCDLWRGCTCGAIQPYKAGFLGGEQ